MGKDMKALEKKLEGTMSEFKKFILKGNIIDMAVGVIIGGAFTAIVTSLNKDIITPILAIFGGVDFSNLTLKMGTSDNAPILMYGSFLTAVINFLITAFTRNGLHSADFSHSPAQMRLYRDNASPVCPPWHILPHMHSGWRHLPGPSCADPADYILSGYHTCQYPLLRQFPRTWR